MIAITYILPALLPRQSNNDRTQDSAAGHGQAGLCKALSDNLIDVDIASVILLLPLAGHHASLIAKHDILKLLIIVACLRTGN